MPLLRSGLHRLGRLRLISWFRALLIAVQTAKAEKRMPFEPSLKDRDYTLRTGLEYLASSFLFAIGCAGRSRWQRQPGGVQNHPRRNSSVLGTIHQPADISEAAQFGDRCP